MLQGEAEPLSKQRFLGMHNSSINLDDLRLGKWRNLARDLSLPMLNPSQLATVDRSILTSAAFAALDDLVYLRAVPYPGSITNIISRRLSEGKHFTAGDFGVRHRISTVFWNRNRSLDDPSDSCSVFSGSGDANEI